jgi:hypothetical protein
MNYPKGLYERTREIKTAEQIEKEAEDTLKSLLGFRLKFNLEGIRDLAERSIAEIENYGLPHNRRPTELLNEVMQLAQMMAQVEQARAMLEAVDAGETRARKQEDTAYPF